MPAIPEDGHAFRIAVRRPGRGGPDRVGRDGAQEPRRSRTTPRSARKPTCAAATATGPCSTRRTTSTSATASAWSRRRTAAGWPSCRRAARSSGSARTSSSPTTSSSRPSRWSTRTPTSIGSTMTSQAPVVGKRAVRGTTVFLLPKNNEVRNAEGTWVSIYPPDGKVRYIRAEAIQAPPAAAAEKAPAVGGAPATRRAAGNPSALMPQPQDAVALYQKALNAENYDPQTAIALYNRRRAATPTSTARRRPQPGGLAARPASQPLAEHRARRADRLRQPRRRRPGREQGDAD